MRITAAAKAEMRVRLLEAGGRLFTEKGFEQTTTRDLASEVGVAAGTLFNYFPTKEALAMTLLADAFAAGRESYREQRRGGEGLAEDLFALTACELRALRAHRGFVAPVLETAFSPFARAAVSVAGEETRLAHLETVGEIARTHGVDVSERAVVMHLYWTLYLGVLGHWTADDSPTQAETLAVLDSSMRLFAETMTGAER